MGTLGAFISGEYFFVAFIGADYNRCLWIYKITGFIILVRVVVVVCVSVCMEREEQWGEGGGGGVDVNFLTFAGGGVTKIY